MVPRTCGFTLKTEVLEISDGAFFLAKESDDHDMVKSWVPSISEHPCWLVVWNTAAIAQVPSSGVADFTERWAGV